MPSRGWHNMGYESLAKVKRFLVGPPPGPIMRFLSPRLGILDQYPPMPLTVPAYYHHTAPPVSPLRISIVTPSFNQARFLQKTITSVLDQKYPALEYIVQDGGSTDGSVDILEQYGSRLTRWESAPDRGQAEAINKGFRNSSGDIMAYLNSDDVLLPGALNYVADFFAKNAGIDVLYSHRILIDQEDREIGRWILPPHVDEVLQWTDLLPQETMFWRRSLWKTVGGCVDERLQFALDWDLILRFIGAGAQFARVPRFLGAFRVHPEQKTLSAMAQVGKREVDAIRRAVHGRDVTSAEAGWRAKGYVLKHMLWHYVYAVGLLRY